MLFDQIDHRTFTFLALTMHRRAKAANLRSSESLNAILKGVAVGGGDTGMSMFFAHRVLQQKIKAIRIRQEIVTDDSPAKGKSAKTPTTGSPN